MDNKLLREKIRLVWTVILLAILVVFLLTEEQSMRELLKLQIKVSELIKEGFIKTYDQLINYLRKIWTEKYQPKELAS